MKQHSHRIITAFLISTIALLGGCASSGPTVDDSRTSSKLQNMKRPTGERPVVTIYNFRSSVYGLSGEAATDMFTTALVKSGQFLVAERAQLDRSVMREKQLNADGHSTGDAASHKLAGAKYIFEGVVSEENDNKDKSKVGGSLRGLNVSTKGAAASIGIDVRVVDARTGLVLDSINVRKEVKRRGAALSGIGTFAQSFTKKNLQGADFDLEKESKEGKDEALRECIEESIYQLATRYGS